MKPSDLKKHKKALKQLDTIPQFSSLKRGKLPKPFKRVGGTRIKSTGMIDVSPDHTALMYWRDGDNFTDRSFYGHLLYRIGSEDLTPVFEFHWHPSHKGFHCKVPCETEYDYTNRNLPGAPELSIKTDSSLDPFKKEDLHKLIIIFCNSCGINLPEIDKDSLALF